MLKAQSADFKYQGYEKIKKIGEGTFAAVFLGHAHLNAAKSTKPADNKAQGAPKETTAAKFVKIAIKRIKPGLFQGNAALLKL